MTVINLNRYRKRREREEARKKADASARRHGRTKADRQRESADRKQLEAAVDGAKLEGDPPDEGDPEA